MISEDSKEYVNEILFLSDEAIRESAYLISRGVRSLALFNPFQADPMLMFRAASRLETLAIPGAIPFVADRNDGWAVSGYAASRGIAETYLWTEQNIKEPHRSRLIGCMLGYSSQAISEFEQGQGIRQFNWKSIVAGSDEQETKLPHCDTHSTEEMSHSC